MSYVSPLGKDPWKYVPSLEGEYEDMPVVWHSLTGPFCHTVSVKCPGGEFALKRIALSLSGISKALDYFSQWPLCLKLLQVESL